MLIQFHVKDHGQLKDQSSIKVYTQGTRVGPGGRDQTLAIKSIKIPEIAISGREKERRKRNTPGTRVGPGGHN